MKTLKFLLLFLLLPFFNFSQIDVALHKTLLSSPPFLYGDLISFEIEVTNYSNVAVNNITIRETFPCGLIYNGSSIAWTPSGNDLIGVLPGPINPGQSAIVFIDFNLNPCLISGAWMNTAEITAFFDGSGNNIFNLDNNIGNNTDTEEAPVFDLALRKRLSTSPPYQYGDILYFEITVFNQGNQPVRNISINDYLPIGVGYDYDPALNTGWTGSPPLLNKVLPNILIPGDSIKTGVYLILKRTSGGTRAWVNYSEIEGAFDLSNFPIFDSDSNPGSNSISENNVLPGDPEDDNIESGGPLFGENEDDHDPAGVDIFDLALIKEQASALSSFSYIQDVDYLITIFNQGNIPATDIEISDYLGEAIVFLNSPKNIGRGWTYDPVTHTATTTYKKILQPGQSDTLMLDVRPLQYYVRHDSVWTNWAEISFARNHTTGNTGQDIDSNPDNVSNNDAGGRPNSNADNFINGDGSGVPGDGVALTDEDDHDPHKIQVFDLALRKRKFTPGTFFSPGDDVQFEITIFNQGNVPAKDIVVSDYVRDGYLFIGGGPNTGWSGSSTLVKHTISETIFPGRDTTIFITLRVQASNTPGAYLNYAEISAARDTLNNNRNDDADSVSDDNPNNDNQVIPGSSDDDNIFGNAFIGEDEDDHDVAGIEFLCQRPTLTAGKPECEPGNGTYSVTFYSNVSTITASVGTVSGSKVTGIPFGTSVTITATNGASCAQSLTVTSPANCPGTGGCTYPELTVGQPLCGTSGWSVSYSTDLGLISVNAGVVSGNTISNIPFGTNLTVTATNALCVSRVDVAAPVNCGVPCANSPITISGPVCETGGAGTYRVNYIVNAGTVVTASAGTLTASSVTGIPSGTSLTLTITTPGCDTRVVVVPAGDCEVCQRPTLTAGIPECEPGNGTYSVTFYSNVSTITASVGTVSGSKVTGIPFGTSVTITATNGANCAQSLTVTSPANCPGTGGCTYPVLTVGQPLCGTGGWSVSYSTDLGIISVNAGVVSGNTISNIPFGTNLTVTATNALCVSRVDVAAPVNCGVPCANSPITISGPVCETGGAGTYRVNYIVNAGTVVTASAGTLTASSVTGIPSGTILTLTITTPGCDTRIVVVPAGDCEVCQRPTLTAGIPECEPGNGTYSVTFYSNVSNITASAGTVSGSKVTGIPIGTSVTITATNGASCAQSLTVTSPANCPGTGGCTYPGLTVGQPLCGTSGWSVSYSTDLGLISVNAGVVSGNTISNIPFGTNLTVTATNALCVSRIDVAAPVNCGVPCANSPITISGPVCETGGAGTYRVNYIVNAGTVVTASAGTLTASSVTGIPSGTNLTLTITTPGCDTRVIVVPAGDCLSGDATIGNFVWHDQNGDGQQGGNEPGISGVIVMLMDPIGNMIAQTTTASNGAYILNGIPPGTYYLKFSIPSGFQSTFALIGNPATDSDVTGTFGAGTTNLFTLTPGQVNNGLDAGFFRCASIGELVWYDTNRNDIRDNQENGINGLRVNLWRNHFGTWTIWDYTITGHKPGTPSDDGWWQFCAPPGQYYIQIIIPPLGLVQVLPNRGNNPNRDSDLINAFGPGTTNSFVVTSGASKLDLAGGYYPMAVAGNLVWRDENLNGLQDPDEPKVSGVKVEAFDAVSHQKLGESITDSEGIYEIDYLQKKDIYLKFDIPQGFSPSIPNAGEDHENSDVDHSFGPNTTRKIGMESGVFNQNIDLGIAFGILPVRWLDVYVKKEFNAHNILWSTENEINVSHFEIERMYGENKSWSTLTEFVKATGLQSKVSSYKCLDTEVELPGEYYYRIKQVDYDGKFSYSKVVSLKKETTNSIKVYPNPATISAELEISITDQSRISVAFYDLHSKLVKQVLTNEIFEAGLHTVYLNLETLPEGVYMLRLNVNDNGGIDKKIIILK